MPICSHMCSPSQLTPVAPLVLPFVPRPTIGLVRHLGVWVEVGGYASAVMESRILDNVTKRIASLRAHPTSLTGRVVLANSMLLSKVWFGAHAIPFSLSFFKLLYALLQGRPPPVRLEVMFGPYHHGGMGLLDFRAHAAKILGTWIAAVTAPTLPSQHWSRAACSNFSHALGLNNPLNPHSLKKYLASHPLATGPH
ncbi:hypothetical protein L0F63_006765, partial [Massospora cicadina]